MGLCVLFRKRSRLVIARATNVSQVGLFSPTFEIKLYGRLFPSYDEVDDDAALIRINRW
jgi:hypothetical protein